MSHDRSRFKLDKKLDWFSDPASGHLVEFYRSDHTLLLLLAEFIGSGLHRGDTCMVICTPPHLRKLHALLKGQNLDIAAMQSSGQYSAFDASETLAKFMVDGLPDRSKFFAIAGALMGQSTKKGKPIRAYGEMVALLWKEGNKDAVIQLENLWNELAGNYEFSLFCGYPDLHFSMDHDVRNEIRTCHNVHVLG